MLKIILKKYYFNIFLDKKYFEPHLLQHILKHPFVSPKTNLKGGKRFPSFTRNYVSLADIYEQTNSERSKQLARQTFSTRTDYLAFSNISQQKKHRN
jgi:hypothetical protein